MKAFGRLWVVGLGLWWMSLVGCPRMTIVSLEGDGGLDAGVAPDAELDGALPDASVPDSSVPDSSVPDSSVPDSSVPDAGDPGPVRPDPELITEVIDCGSTPYEPTVQWDGWRDVGTFASGSDRVRLRIEPDGRGGHRGFLLLGDAPRFDPRPAGPGDCGWLGCGNITAPYEFDPEGSWVEGHEYTLREVRVMGNRIRFAINEHEPIDSLCALQTPSLAGASPEEAFYFCDPEAPRWCADPPWPPDEPLDECQVDGRDISCCTRALCNQRRGTNVFLGCGFGLGVGPIPPCECTEDACHARDASTHHFDFAVDVEVARSSGFGGVVSLVRQ